MANEVNGVTVNLYDTYTEAPISVASRDRTFIFGTASKGPRHTPITPEGSDVESIFGEIKNDFSFDTSIVRGYHEFSSVVANQPDVALIRVGNVKAAKATLYETKAYTTGEFSYTVANSLPSVSMYVEALEEGEKYNTGLITVSSFTASGAVDVAGFPSSLKIEIPGDTEGTTISQTYNLAKVPGAPGVYSSVSELVAAINSTSAFSGKIKASFPAIRKSDLALTITSTSGELNRTYDIDSTGTNESWGNKILSIERAYISKAVSQEIAAGTTQVEMDVSPTKSLTGPATISAFRRHAVNEEILNIGPAQVGQTSKVLNLFCKSVVGWDNSVLITSSTPVVTMLRNGMSEAATVDGADYTISNSAGTITLNITGCKLGDRYFITYKYAVSYQEAKYRSDLVTGSDRSYFIYGSSIVFGAPQPTIVTATYTTAVHFSGSDLEIVDARNSVIRFCNAANLPTSGDIVNFIITYEPELPAVTGAVLGTGVTQNGAFVGGDDGRMLSKKDYLAAVKTAMEAVAIYPRKKNVVMGLYLDDTVQGPNEETGMAELKPMNWFDDIFPLVDDVSENVSECSIVIPVKPITSTNVDTQNAWIDTLVNNSTTDLTRPANIIDSINYFKADVILGLPKVAISKVLNGVVYYANPAVIYAGLVSQLKPGESMTNRALPSSISDLGIKIQSAGLISQLNAKRYTAFTVSHTGKFVVADAPTLGRKNESQFDRQLVRESIFTSIEVARVAAEKYIGKPRKEEYLTAMRKDVLKALATLSKDVLSDFYVELLTVNDGYITGETKMKMILTTSKEIRTVRFETYVKLGS